MIGTALFLLCATAIAHADLDDTEVDGFYDNGCPKDTSIEKLLPHEDCEQYYQCFHGALMSRFCPNGLHFNADLEICDWLGNGDCHNKRDEENGSTSEELDKSNPNHVTLICSSPDSNDVLVAHKNCYQFYKCSYGRALVLSCAKNLLYNTVSEKCDFPQNVKCSERFNPVNEYDVSTTNKDIGFSYSIEEIDQSNSESSQAIAQCSAKRSDGVLVAHKYCNKFYKCFKGLPVTMNCPFTLLYNPIKEYCDKPGNVDCDGRTIAESNDGSTERSVEKNNNTADNEISGDDDDSSAAAICAADNSEGVLFAHEICNYFYKCSGRKPFAYNCPGDLLFNSKDNYCDWPQNIECDERIEPEETARAKKKKTDDPSQALTICSAESSDGILVAHESCNKFYKCHDGRPVLVKCPDILLYNIKKEICDWPTHVNCEDRTVPENGWSLKEGDKNNVDSESDNDDEINVKSRKKKGSNPGKKKIKSKSRYHKKIRAKVGTANENLNADLNKAARSCADKSFDGKIFPHENCNQFYKCIEGKEVALFCPLNLYYNIYKEICDWPFNVACGKRIAPE